MSKVNFVAIGVETQGIDKWGLLMSVDTLDDFLAVVWLAPLRRWIFFSQVEVWLSSRPGGAFMGMTFSLSSHAPSLEGPSFSLSLSLIIVIIIMMMIIIIILLFINLSCYLLIIPLAIYL